MVTGPSLFDLSDRDSPDQNHGCLVISFATATTSLFFQVRPADEHGVFLYLTLLSNRRLHLGFSSTIWSLARQAFVLSMAVRKFLKPKSAIAFSRKLVYNCRNGQPCLQMRIMNLRGTVISDVKASLATTGLKLPQSLISNLISFGSSPFLLTAGAGHLVVSSGD